MQLSRIGDTVNLALGGVKMQRDLKLTAFYKDPIFWMHVFLKSFKDAPRGSVVASIEDSSVGDYKVIALKQVNN